MIKFTHGDLFTVPADIRVNTVNCVGVMGTGVALAFKQRYPAMFKDYQRACKEGLVQPGKLHEWRSLDGDWVINFPTKRHWREPSRYEDIADGLNALRDYLQPLGKVTVALPALGCGNGGLDWKRVSQMIEDKLTGLAAEIWVYAPSDSRSAGKVAAEEPSDEEVNAARQLGYTRITPVCSEDRQVCGILFGKGRLELLGHPWIGLLPSRKPGDRELRAIRSVAAELAARNDSVVVALVHGSRASEEVAQLFVDQGVNVVMLLPFGILTRKALARTAGVGGSGSVTLISSAPLNAKWTHALFAQTLKYLQNNSSAFLLTDPDHSWLTRHGSSGWRDRPTFFLRYETIRPDIKEILDGGNVFAIGRRSEDGAPNLESLLNAFQKGLACNELSVVDPVGGINSAALANAPKHEDQGWRPFNLDLSSFPEDRWTDVVNLIRQAGPRSVTISADIVDAAARTSLEQEVYCIKQEHEPSGD